VIYNEPWLGLLIVLFVWYYKFDLVNVIVDCRTNNMVVLVNYAEHAIVFNVIRMPDLPSRKMILL